MSKMEPRKLAISRDGKLISTLAIYQDQPHGKSISQVYSVAILSMNQHINTDTFQDD